MGSPASASNTLDYAASLPFEGPIHYLVKPDTDYGKASSVWRQTQEAVSQAEKELQHQRRLKRLSRFSDKREKKVGVFCHKCKEMNCGVDHDWSDHILGQDAGGQEPMEDLEPEGKSEKPTPAKIKKFRDETVDKIIDKYYREWDDTNVDEKVKIIGKHHKEWKDANLDEKDLEPMLDEELEGKLRGDKPKTLATACCVCGTKTEYNPEYQAELSVTCSDKCFLKDYAGNADKLEQCLLELRKIPYLWGVLYNIY